MNRARFPGKSVNSLNKQHHRRTVSFHDVKTINGAPDEYKKIKAELVANLPTLRKVQFNCDGLDEKFIGFSSEDDLKSNFTRKQSQLESLVSNLELLDGQTIKEDAKFSKSKKLPRGANATVGTRPPSKRAIKRKYPFDSADESPVKQNEKQQDVLITNDFATPIKQNPQSSAAINEFDYFSENKTIKLETELEAVTAIKYSTTTKVSPIFFQGKEEHVAAVTILVDDRLNQQYDNLSQTSGLIQCGVCLEITESNILGPQRKHGAFLCSKCIDFLQKMIKIAKKAVEYTCKFQGVCEISQKAEYCEACFVRSCLLLLDFTDDIYFKMWRAVPAKAKNWVPPTPPVAKRYENRGSVVFANQFNGSILAIVPFKNKTASNGTAKGKGVKRLLPNDNASLSKVSGARVKQVARRDVESDRLPRATFGDEMEIMQSNNSGTLGKKILLDRLEYEEKLIKVICPLESVDVEENGYPVIVVSNGEKPPKPLCFVCGSAGIKQLIFCSACCEPFHPYCSEDELLVSAFLVEYLKISSDDGKQLVPNCQCSSTIQHTCAPCNSVVRRFRKWKCYRCTTCKTCSKGTMPFQSQAKKNKFLKCFLCNDSYHYSCAKKISSFKTDDSEKWLCQNCLKCTSCGIQLAKSLQNHFRKLSTDDNGNQQERDILCLECFRRRQKGSFCPVCFVCYDDNDWDTKMIECEKCHRWIHAKCEDLDDEKYFILSSLPEAVAYICRICVKPTHEVGWRLAITAERNDSCYKVLDFFQKKAVGMSRKRRALTFDEDDVPNTVQSSTYFEPIQQDTLSLTLETNDSAIEISPPQYQTPTVHESETENIKETEEESEDMKLLRKYNIQQCFVNVIDMDITNVHLLQISSSPSKNNRKSEDKNTNNNKEIMVTPTKQPNTCSSNDCRSLNSQLVLSPVLIFTPTRIVTSFTDAIKTTSSLWTSVEEFRRMCLQLIPNYFTELESSTTRFEEYFEDAIKQVFPWFNCPEPSREEKNVTESSSDASFDSEKSLINTILDDNKVIAAEGVKPTIIEEELQQEQETIAFEDVYWDESSFMDYRECSFCKEIGDFPVSSVGRLLYAGPGEWVHVNCAIWSSEVYEEDSGALKQIEIALNRSKKSKCDFCESFGATINCCAGTCRRVYHFFCAIEANCSLMNDKTLFCSQHEASAKGTIQKDMHVTRKVFVDLDVSRKKDIKLLSKDLQVYIGCMQIDSLGHLVPISLVDLNSSKSLVPINYECKRMRWSALTPKTIEIISLKTSVKHELPNCCANKEMYYNDCSYSIVIDHSKKKHVINYQTDKKNAFLDWVKRAPRIIDEYNVEYIANYYGPQMKPQDSKKKTRKKLNGFQPFEIDNELKYNMESVLTSASPLVYKAKIDWDIKRNVHLEKSPESSDSFETLKLELNYPVFETEKIPVVDLDLNSLKRHNTQMKNTGLTHPALVFLTEQLPGVENIVGKYDFNFNVPYVALEDSPVVVNESGSARTSAFCGRKPFDMFGWLRSKHRNAPAPPLAINEETIKSIGLPIAMRFRNLKGRANKDLVVLSSHIHGRGLFATRDIDKGEMLIEYAGEVIRSSLCDLRENKYENRGIGCYMFRIDRLNVIDATMKGNAARFINHSCEPNCQASPHKILGKDHILIFALKNIGRGEELTYDYRFEEEADKLLCSCSSKKCRKFMN